MSDKFEEYTITVKEAAQILGISERSVTRRINQDELDAVKKKGSDGRKRWYINENEDELNAPQVIEDVLDVVEVDKPISVSEFKQQSIEPVQKEVKELKKLFKQLLEQNHQLKEQNEQLVEQNKQLIEQNQSQANKMDELEKKFDNSEQKITEQVNKATLLSFQKIVKAQQQQVSTLLNKIDQVEKTVQKKNKEAENDKPEILNKMEIAKEENNNSKSIWNKLLNFFK